MGQQKQLDGWLEKTAEAEKRDHRKLGRELDLFHFQDNAPGAVFWHRGWTIFQSLIAYMRSRHEVAGYVEVNTPDVMDRSLWEISGHWDNYRDHMFTTQTEDGRNFALKPMNCHGAVSLFKYGIKSYRDLPVRLSEFGKVHRYEPSGSLHGLLRVRHFTQDDAHIFCTLQQVEGNVKVSFSWCLIFISNLDLKRSQSSYPLVLKSGWEATQTGIGWKTRSQPLWKRRDYNGR